MALPNLNSLHRVLTLRAALGVLFKEKNFIMATFVARRLLRLEDVKNSKK